MAGVTARRASRLSDLFDRLAKQGKKALAPFFMAGYPDMGSSGEMIVEGIDAGADFVEIGMPFSDPLADGPVIQQATYASLAGGMNTSRLLKLVRGLRKHAETPIVILSYLNPLLQYGLSAFLRDAREAGVDGLVVPDLTWEAGRRYHSTFQASPIDLVPLLAPTSTMARVRRIASEARGFLYLVSVTGVTGERKQLAGDLREFVARVRKATTVPVCVGFGISTPEQAREVTRCADGVIVGSAIVQRIASAADTNVAREEVRRLLDAMRGEIDRA